MTTSPDTLETSVNQIEWGATHETVCSAPERVQPSGWDIVERDAPEAYKAILRMREETPGREWREKHGVPPAPEPHYRDR